MWKKRRNILHFALVFFVSTEINFEGLGHGREGADSTGEGRRRQEGTDGAWISVPVSGNGFSKYSVETTVTGRNRPRFAIQAHCGLLVTSMSPNCCLLNGILRKSYFPAQSSGNPCTPCPVPPPLPFPMLSALSLPRPPKLISMYVKYTNKIISLRACPFGKEQGQAKERPGEGVPGDIFSLLHEGK